MAMSTDDNDAYGDLDKSNLKFIYEQFLSIIETKKEPFHGSLNVQLAGVAGLEPTHAGFRDPCLTNLAIPLCDVCQQK